jgi:hypothetical protein
MRATKWDSRIGKAPSSAAQYRDLQFRRCGQSNIGNFIGPIVARTHEPLQRFEVGYASETALGRGFQKNNFRITTQESPKLSR